MSKAVPNFGGSKYVVVDDLNGGESYQVVVTPVGNNLLQLDNLIVSQDATDKRLITDAQRTQLSSLTTDGVDAIVTSSEQKVASVAAVDMNSAAEQTLYTVPGGKTFIPTRIVVRNASTSLTTVSFGIGFNAGTDNNVLASATHTELTGNTLYTILAAKVGSAIGAAAAVLALKNTILQGGAATVTIDVFGYLF